MKIIEKIKKKQADIWNERQPTIAFLGDSVTHGCFELYVKNDRIEAGVRTKDSYSEKVKAIFGKLYPTVPLNIINAGLSGDTAENGLKRLERDVLSYRPDTVVVCYGLNDAMFGRDGAETYINSLKRIFGQIKSAGAEIIFLTPNVRSDNLSILFEEEKLNDCAKNVIKNEREGWLTEYLNTARELCKSENIVICDCNHIWNMFRSNDVDINNILSNRINHPTEEMGQIFAYELVRTMFEN